MESVAVGQVDSQEQIRRHGKALAEDADVFLGEATLAAQDPRTQGAVAQQAAEIGGEEAVLLQLGL